MEKNKKRFFVEAVTQAAQKEGIETSWLSDDWICILTKGEKREYIYGYNFPLNSATSWEIAKDKAATSEILTKNKIGCVEHYLCIRPDLEVHGSGTTQGSRLYDVANTTGYPLVCKDNCGSGGNNVFRVFSQNELTDISNSIWQKSRGISLCPLYDVEYEYRFFVLDGKIEFAFKKIKIEPEWKCNLSKGAGVELVEVGSILESISQMAIESARCLNLRVCSVDIIKIKNSQEHRVLEVNTSITAEYFSQTSSHAKDLSEKLYLSILKKIFKEK